MWINASAEETHKVALGPFGNESAQVLASRRTEPTRGSTFEIRPVTGAAAGNVRQVLTVLGRLAGRWSYLRLRDGRLFDGRKQAAPDEDKAEQIQIARRRRMAYL